MITLMRNDDKSYNKKIMISKITDYIIQNQIITLLKKYNSFSLNKKKFFMKIYIVIVTCVFFSLFFFFSHSLNDIFMIKKKQIFLFG